MGQYIEDGVPKRSVLRHLLFLISVTGLNNNLTKNTRLTADDLRLISLVYNNLSHSDNVSNDLNNTSDRIFK